MILAEKYEFISLRTNHRPSPGSKSSRISLRSSLEILLKNLGWIVEVNMTHMSFQTSTRIMESNDISLPNTLKNKMNLLNERTIPS